MHKNFILTNIFKDFLYILIIIVISCLTGYLLLVMVYCIPTKNMEAHVRESVPIFLKEGDYPKVTDSTTSQLDNFTDALMLLTASYPMGEGKKVWEYALDATRYDIKGESPVKALINCYGENASEIDTINYQHYWHGYLIFLKPILCVFSYAQIRYIIIVFQLCLFSLLVTRIYAIRKEFIVPTLIMWSFLNPIATMCSLQFNSILVLTFVSMILIIRFKECWKGDLHKWKMFFLLIGILTSYLDLLTYPLVTLGVPITLWLAIDFSINDKLRNSFISSVFWLIGYGGMWAGKWLLGSIVTGDAVIQRAMERILVRTSSIAFDKDFTYGAVLKNELKLIWKYLFVVVIVLIIHFTIKSIQGIIKSSLKDAVIYVIIGTYPFIWTFILKNHTYVHWWFVYREFVITIYALLMMCFQQIGMTIRETKENV